jgi:hypothetical protein
MSVRARIERRGVPAAAFLLPRVWHAVVAAAGCLGGFGGRNSFIIVGP